MLAVTLLLTTPFAQSDVAWGLLFGVAIAAVIFAFLAWNVEDSERRDRLKDKCVERELRTRPFHKVRIVVWHQRTLVPADFDRIPIAYEEGATPTSLCLPDENRSILIQASPRAGDFITGGNLRFLGAYPKVVVQKVYDAEPRGADSKGAVDAEYGYDFWYYEPKYITEGRSVYFAADIIVQKGLQWDGELSLLLELGKNGTRASIRIPCSVRPSTPGTATPPP